MEAAEEGGQCGSETAWSLMNFMMTMISANGLHQCWKVWSCGAGGENEEQGEENERRHPMTHLVLDRKAPLLGYPFFVHMRRRRLTGRPWRWGC